mgnify:CR=1 FL=1
MGEEVSFLPATSEWFEQTFGVPTEAQTLAWPAIRTGENVLLEAPTGSGKTLAAFLWALDGLYRQELSQPQKHGLSHSESFGARMQIAILRWQN